MTASAALLVGMAVSLLVMRPRRWPWAGASSRLGRRRSGSTALVSLAAIGAVLLVEAGFLVAVVVPPAVAGVLWLRHGARARRESDAERGCLVEAADALASELRAGIPAMQALAHVASGWPLFGPVAAAAVLGGDVSGALRRQASTPGAEALVGIAAAWQIAQQSGSGLAAALDRAAARARSDLDVRRVVAGELASARATARMVAVLPVVLLTLAGGRPAWGFLLTTVPGVACLGAGLALAFVGMWWMERIVNAVEEG